jgi:hypothetical protein
MRMKYYKLIDYYRRDVSFYPYEERNTLSNLELIRNKGKLEIEKIYYEVDKIDNYINNYDMLPGAMYPLVSEKMKNLIEKIACDTCQFVPAIIVDEKGKTNTDFFLLNVIVVADCIDREKSEYTVDKYSPDGVDIVNLYFDYNKLGKHHICMLDEFHSTIIVSDTFVTECRKNKIKRLLFVKEGLVRSPEFLEE